MAESETNPHSQQKDRASAGVDWSADLAPALAPVEKSSGAAGPKIGRVISPVATLPGNYSGRLQLLGTIYSANSRLLRSSNNSPAAPGPMPIGAALAGLNESTTKRESVSGLNAQPPAPGSQPLHGQLQDFD